MRAKNNEIPLMRHINYYDDYQRLLERLAENYSGMRRRRFGIGMSGVLGEMLRHLWRGD